MPAHVRLEGNNIVDERARHAELNGAVFEIPLPPMDFQGLARSVLLREWQRKRDAADTGRFAQSILPKVSLRPWFDGQGFHIFYQKQLIFIFMCCRETCTLGVTLNYHSVKCEITFSVTNINAISFINIDGL
jgi:hypothetical protein